MGPPIAVVQGGRVYAPEPIGQASILSLGGTIVRVGGVDVAALDGLNVPFDLLDADGALVVPGLVDPHQHVAGAGGEQGFASRMPPVSFQDEVLAGCTTVVGCLGTDTTTRGLNNVLGTVRQLSDEGISAYMHTGGYQVPTPTITGSVMDDMVIVDSVIGVGEVAIADDRATEPTARELARLVTDAHVGASLSGKGGVVLFHVGPGKRRLALLHELLDEFDIPADRLHAVHVSRSGRLMDDAIGLAKRGAHVGIDTVNEDLGRWVRYYLDHGGPSSQLGVCSDTGTPGGSPGKHFGQLVSCVRDHGLPLQEVLPLFTSNTARALHLSSKGRIGEACDADLLVLDPDTLDVIHVVARGRVVVRDGRLSGGGAP